jgi:hypothetical protein
MDIDQATGQSASNTTSADGQHRQGQQQGQQQPSTPQPQGQTNTPAQGTFNQDDVDRIVRERLDRERAKYADYDDLKQRAQNWDTFLEESKSEAQKALDTARGEAEASAYARARQEFGAKLVEAHLRATAAGRLDDGALTALLGGVNTANFLTAAGDVDTTKINQFIDGIAPTTTPAARLGGFGQGSREGAPRRGLEAGRAAYEARHRDGQAPPLF